MVCFCQTSACANHSAWSIQSYGSSPLEMEKLFEESVVLAEFWRGAEEQEGRQLTKIPKRSSLDLLAN